ncbi:VOC family protein [Actinoplanes subtropicus]|uniref:VOC family protein n=1 Tax=Actinoplanes subtropicus TaxID=543632 RepID=UPI0004C2C8E7|nr:VOC family protein [Actinoplanes subtropicus]
MPRLTIAYDAHDPARLARFWATLLDRQPTDDPLPPGQTLPSTLLPGADGQLGLRFTPSSTAKRGANRMHLHLTSTSDADQQRTVAKALGLGATHLDVGQRPEEGHIVLADPEGNEFCVIEPGNSFLAGCGYLGELACDGAREVGLFWSAALGWPLVWDQGEETAIQSPQGGTKVAWGGPPDAPVQAPHRQRFDLTAPGGDQQAEVGRLTGLGATWLRAAADGSAVLIDPGGNEFRLHR